MNQTLLTLAVASALALTLAGCSDSGGGDDPAPVTPPANDDGGGDGGDTDTGGDPDTGDTDGGDTGGGDTGGGGAVVPDRPSGPRAPSGAGAPSGDTKAGNYFGASEFGAGDGQGVYVIDARNELAALVLFEDGSARSYFGTVGDGDTFDGTFRTYEHSASNPPTAGGFGTGPSGPEAIMLTDEFALAFTPGVEIDNGGSAVTFSTSQLAAATIASVDGVWRGVNEFGDCAGTGVCRLVFDITFADGVITGNTSLENGAGEQSRISPIAGDVVEYGETLLLDFSWTDSGTTGEYQGIAFFPPDRADQLVFLGEVSGESGNPTLASLLQRVQ